MKRAVAIAVAALSIWGVIMTQGSPAQAATGPHSAAWSRFLAHCHRTHACRPVPPAVRRFYSIGAHDPARLVLTADTTWTVWLHDGRMHRQAS